MTLPVSRNLIDPTNETQMITAALVTLPAILGTVPIAALRIVVILRDAVWAVIERRH